MTDRYDLHLGDCLEVLKALPDASVDFVLTDPPYPCIKREYGYWTEAEWFDVMRPAVREMRRVLKPEGSAVLILQPNSERLGRMRIWLWEFMAWAGKEWNIVQDAYWWNTTAFPEAHAIQGRLLRPSLKSCVWLGEPTCYRNQDAVLNELSERHASRIRKYAAVSSSGRQSFPSGQGVDVARMSKRAGERGGTSPFNVIACNHGYSQRSAGALGHGAGTPILLCDWWVRYLSKLGDTILDPFSGTATVGLAALNLGRRYIGIERSPRWHDVAHRRLAEAAQASKLFAEVPA